MARDPETNAQLANILEMITDKSDPDTRKTVLKAIQKKDPKVSFSELDHDRSLGEVQKAIGQFKHEQETAKISQHLENQRQGLVSRGYSPDEISKIESEVMQKHGISDYDVAAKVYEADRPAPPPSYDIRGKRPWKAESLKSFMSNPKDRAREVASEVIQEMRSQGSLNPFNRRFG